MNITNRSSLLFLVFALLNKTAMASSKQPRQMFAPANTKVVDLSENKSSTDANTNSNSNSNSNTETDTDNVTIEDNNYQHDDGTQLPPPLHMQTHPLLQVPCSIQLAGTVTTTSSTTTTTTTSGTTSTMAMPMTTEKRTPIQTFVDTGAQVSVLSVQAAGRAGVLQMMDRRYAGHAQGVGQCRVLGRLPAGALYLHLHGQVVVEAPAVTILEHTNDGVDLLLGLDFLRDRGAILNLRTEEMLLQSPDGEVSIPFIRPRVAMDFGPVDGIDDAAAHSDDGDCHQDHRLCLRHASDDEEDDEIPFGIDMSGV
jgi:hypothetical protein